MINYLSSRSNYKFERRWILLNFNIMNIIDAHISRLIHGKYRPFIEANRTVDSECKRLERKRVNVGAGQHIINNANKVKETRRVFSGFITQFHTAR